MVIENNAKSILQMLFTTLQKYLLFSASEGKGLF